jgi:hypothetical protein
MKTTLLIILLFTISQLIACVKQDFCSCFSGFDGLQCENQASTTTCTWNKNSLTKTDFYPTADTSKVFFNDDKLFMSIKAPLVEDRLETKFKMKPLDNVHIQGIMY